MITLNITVIASLISTIISAIVAYLVSRYKSNRDADLAYRKEWDTIFIKSLSELIESASLLHHGENVVGLGKAKHSELMHKANAQKFVLKLILDRESEEKMNKLIHLIIYQMFEGNAKPGDKGSPLNKAIDDAIIEAQVVRQARLKK